MYSFRSLLLTFLEGLKFYVLNKEPYGYIMQPMSGGATLHDSQMKFQYIKLEFIGKDDTLTLTNSVQHDVTLCNTMSTVQVCNNVLR